MKRISKKIALLGCVCFCAWGCFSAGELPVYAAGGEETAEEDNNRTTNLTWYYKEIDGVLYMRLWNHLTQEWVTDWVPAVG